MNRERLQMVRDRIASEPPERLRMDWVSTPPTESPKCGTAHCIAGWANELFGSEPACVELSLSNNQSDSLFTPKGWITPGAYTRDDALAALDSLIRADSEDALPVWPEPRNA